MNLELAKRLGDEATDILGRLDTTVHWAKGACTEEEFEWYRTMVGRVMGSLVLDLLNPFYERHPEVKPKGVD